MVTNSSQLWLVKLDHVTLKVKGVPFLVLCSVFGKIKLLSLNDSDQKRWMCAIKVESYLDLEY